MDTEEHNEKGGTGCRLYTEMSQAAASDYNMGGFFRYRLMSCPVEL